MTDSTPLWKQLELIIVEIQKQLAPNAQVRHNHKVKGRSGRIRKLDVTITQNVGAYPVFIVFDCKHRTTRPVEISDVEAFAVQVEDVNGSLGVMISDSGFDEGAKAIADMKNIVLQTYRKAHETDWKKLILDLEMLRTVLIGFRITEVKVSAITTDDILLEVPFNMPFYDESGNPMGKIDDTFWDTWGQIGRPIGEVNVQVRFQEESFIIEMKKEILRVKEFLVNARLIAKKFLLDLNLAEGHILEDNNEGQPVYEEFTSKSFDWANIMKNQPGIEINPEEYEQILKDSRVATDLGNAERFIRIVATNTHQADRA